jgi:hypothetical protein
MLKEIAFFFAIERRQSKDPRAVVPVGMSLVISLGFPFLRDDLCNSFLERVLPITS